MRSYASNSQEAVCRLLALSMIVDGRLLPSELRAMHASAILERIGAAADTFDEVVHALCADLLARASLRDDGDVVLDARLLDRLLDDVVDPLLRMATLKAMRDIVHVDRLLDSREHLLLGRALKKWSAHHDRPAAWGAGPGAS